MAHVPASVQVLRPASEGARRAGGRTRRRAHVLAVPRGTGRRSMPEVLDLALEVLRERFALLVGLSALAWLPVRALHPLLGQSAVPTNNPLLDAFQPLVVSLPQTASAAVAQTFATALLARVVFAHLEGGELALGATLRSVLLRFPAVLVIAVVTGLLTGLGTCACLVPGILVAWKLTLAPLACVLEGQGVFASLRRSWRLSARSFWRWFLLSAGLYLLMLPFSTASSLTDVPAARGEALAWSGLSSASFDLVVLFGSSLLLGVATALHATAMTVYYADCRVRRDGSDLQRELDGLRATAASAEGRP